MLARLRHRVLALGLFLALGGPSGNADGTTFEAGGLSFSDELGGFHLISASGQGTPSDPIVLVEELSSLSPAVLTIRQTGSSPAQHVLQCSLIKIVINRSAWSWSGFDLELRGSDGRASIYTDGLSFDQPRVVMQPLSSDQFAKIQIQDEPFDRLRFDHGRVKLDQTVRLGFNIVDINSRALFYLAQEPIALVAERKDTPISQRFVYAADAFELRQ